MFDLKIVTGVKQGHDYIHSGIKLYSLTWESWVSDINLFSYPQVRKIACTKKAIGNI